MTDSNGPSTEPKHSRGSLGQRMVTRMFSSVIPKPNSSPELLETLREAQENAVIDQDALQMLEGVLQVADMQVREVMIPRAQMVVLERDAQYNDLLKLIVESGHSRFPVVDDNRDDVVGILLAKDVLRYEAAKIERPFSIREVIRPAVFIPESKRLNVLLREFRDSRNHMAIVVDEYGGVAGLVTIEDVLEQIVGEIDDEHDIDTGSSIFRHDKQRYSVKALTDVEEFNQYFKADLNVEAMDTIGGLVMQAFGYMPKRGEHIEYEGFDFTVLRADSRRIYLLQVKPPAGFEASADAE